VHRCTGRLKRYHRPTLPGSNGLRRHIKVVKCARTFDVFEKTGIKCKVSTGTSTSTSLNDVEVLCKGGLKLTQGRLNADMAFGIIYRFALFAEGY
jgi:hypothetical protein